MKNKHSYSCPFCKKQVISESEIRPNQLLNHIVGTHYKDNATGNKYTGEEIIKIIENSDTILSKNVRKYLVDKFDFSDEIESNQEKIPSNIDKYAEYKLDGYFNSNNPICREERQYALYLANVLNPKTYRGKTRKNVHDTVKKLLGLEEFQVIEVYYEVTFMRDFWNINGAVFNIIYKNYLEKHKIGRYETQKDDIEYNTNGSGINPNYWAKKPAYVKWLMNAKPDIALLLKKGKIYYLTIIECKYKSKEGKYKKDMFEMKQVEVQRCIYDFLLSNEGLHLKYNKNENTRIMSMKQEQKIIYVQFVDEKSQKVIEPFKAIEIATIIPK